MHMYLYNIPNKRLRSRAGKVWHPRPRAARVHTASTRVLDAALSSSIFVTAARVKMAVAGAGDREIVEDLHCPSAEDRLLRLGLWLLVRLD